MTLIKSNSFFPSVPRFFDDFYSKDLFDWGLINKSVTNTSLPAVNVAESNDGYTLEMAAPGMKKEDFEIELNDQVLTITSQKEVTNELKEGDRITHREFSYQSFQRSFRLPKSSVDELNITAKYEDGILRVMIPKKEEAKVFPARQISIE